MIREVGCHLLAVIACENGGDGWESNPPRTPQQRPANGFEDRGTSVRGRPPRLAELQALAQVIHGCLGLSALVRRVE
jgi:hypothetical protein